jgi:hypothetical protein
MDARTEIDVRQLIRTPADALKARRFLHAAAREDFWEFRKLLSSMMYRCWWQRNVAWHLQQFHADLLAGKRPKLVIQGPPQHGKSEQIRDFICWLIGNNPNLKIIFTSYSDELGMTTNLSVQRKMASLQFTQAFHRLKLPGGARTLERWRNTTNIIELPGFAGSQRGAIQIHPLIRLACDSWQRRDQRLRMRERNRRI